MKEKGFGDELMNRFKLIIYNWDIDMSIKHYKIDNFCHLFCIYPNNEYGCTNKSCTLPHNEDFLISRYIYGSQENLFFGKILCQYLIYLKLYNNNSQLFTKYASVLHDAGKTSEDFLVSEKYYKKSINIDYNNATAHCYYGMLLHYHLNNDIKSEKEYKIAITLKPNNVKFNFRLAIFLKKNKDKTKQFESIKYFKRY